MKFPHRTAWHLILLAAVIFSLSGCGKIKAFIARKPGSKPPTQTEPSPTATSGKSAAVSPAAPASAAHTPSPSVAPAPPSINKSAGVMVLCYHRLEEKPRPKDALAITPAQFEKEMQAIKDANFSVIPMQDFLAWRRGEKDIPARSCIITIDDGYVSGYEAAWPILKKFGYPFTMFVYIHYIGSGGKSISWDQLAEMRDAGVDIQSHSYYHDNLRNPPSSVDATTLKLIRADIQALGMDGYLRKEVVESKQVLEKQLGIKVNCLAYPYGNYSPRVRELVKEAGYEAAFTVYGQRLTHSTPVSDILGRYAVSQTDPKIFQDALAMQGGGVGGSLPSGPSMSQMAGGSMITQPLNGETISNPKPLIKANLATMGEIDPASVKMRISGLGPVPAKYDAATKTVSYQVPQPLQAKSVSVIISATVGGRTAETRWDFNYAAKP